MRTSLLSVSHISLHPLFVSVPFVYSMYGNLTNVPDIPIRIRFTKPVVDFTVWSLSSQTEITDPASGEDGVSVGCGMSDLVSVDDTNSLFTFNVSVMSTFRGVCSYWVSQAKGERESASEQSGRLCGLGYGTRCLHIL